MNWGLELAVFFLCCMVANVVALLIANRFEESQRTAIYFAFSAFFLGGIFYVNVRGRQGEQNRRLDRIEAKLEQHFDRSEGK